MCYKNLRFTYLLNSVDNQLHSMRLVKFLLTNKNLTKLRENKKNYQVKMDKVKYLYCLFIRSETVENSRALRVKVKSNVTNHTLCVVFQSVEYFPNRSHRGLFAHKSNVGTGVAFSCL